MTLEGSTTVPFQGNGSFGVVHSYDVPTNSFSSEGVSYSGVLKNSIAGAMALVSLGQPFQGELNAFSPKIPRF